MSPDWPTFWTAVSALGQLLSTVLAVGALLYSIRTFNKSVLLANYGALDQLYSELLRLGIERPHLRMPGTSRTPEQQQQYESYAHLVWCFAESVYDHSRINRELLRSWRSAVEIEVNLHREWLEQPERRYMFKPEFHEWIASAFPPREEL